MDTLIVKLPLDLVQLKRDLPAYAAALVRELEKAIFDLSLRDVDINTSLATAQADLDTAEAALATAQGDISDLESAVSGLSVLVSDDAYGSGWNGEGAVAPSQNAVYDKVQTLMALTGANLAIGSDADGDMYYRASSVLARLAKSTANFKLFMNAGATAPEWANGIKIGTFTRAMDAATGDVAYTGVGFKPSHVVFLTRVETASMVIGVDDGTNHYCVAIYLTSVYFNSSAHSLYAIEAVGKTQRGIIKTLDADGFTLTWTREGATASANATVYYIAFR